MQRIGMICYLNHGFRSPVWIWFPLLATVGCSTVGGPAPTTNLNPSSANVASNTGGPPSTLAEAPYDDVLDDPVLNARLETNIEPLVFDGTPFDRVVETIRERTGLSVHVDWQSLHAGGLERSTPVTAKLRDMKISTALALIFKSFGGEEDEKQLGYTTNEGVVTITTKKQLNKIVVTRRYDINDLLFVPQDYSNDPDLRPQNVAQNQTGVASHQRQDRINELKEFIMQNVEPASWKGAGGEAGSISSSPLRAILLITQTLENQRKITIVLGYLRAGQNLQVSVEQRFAILDDETIAELPDAVRTRLSVPTVKANADQMIDQDALGELIRATSDRIKSAPRLTIFSGQRAILVVQQSQEYTQSWSPAVTTVNGVATTVYKPVTASVAKEGFALNVQATVSSDRQSVLLDLNPQVVMYSTLVIEPWKLGPAALGLSVQRPVTIVSNTHTSCSIPDGKTLLIECGRFGVGANTNKIPDDPAIVRHIDTAKTSHLYMLVKPTILQVKPPVANH